MKQHETKPAKMTTEVVKKMAKESNRYCKSFKKTPPKKNKQLPIKMKEKISN